MLTLWFEKCGGRRKLKQWSTKDWDDKKPADFGQDEILDEVYEFCTERDFRIHYVRRWEQDGEIYYDVGSWSEFFVLTGEKEDIERILYDAERTTQEKKPEAIPA